VMWGFQLGTLGGTRAALDGGRRREAARPVGDRCTGVGEAGKGEKNQRRASLPPGETSGALGCRRSAARRRHGKLPSQAAMAAAARVLGF
jgi:hypothetical protein